MGKDDFILDAGCQANNKSPTATAEGVRVQLHQEPTGMDKDVMLGDMRILCAHCHQPLEWESGAEEWWHCISQDWRCFSIEENPLQPALFEDIALRPITFAKPGLLVIEGGALYTVREADN